MAGLTAHGSLPAFIGYTTLGAELFGQLRTWGLFLRFDFLTSGDVSQVKTTSAGYSAFTFDLGASYRLFGDSHTLSLFARAGLVYEHWDGQETSPCSIDLFVPTSCTTQPGQATGYEGDTVGATGGVRLEIPLRSFYVAFGANFVPTVTFHTSNDTAGVPVTALQPGDVFQLRFDVAVGLRDARGEHSAHHDYNEHRNSY